MLAMQDIPFQEELMNLFRNFQILKVKQNLKNDLTNSSRIWKEINLAPKKKPCRI